MSSSTGTGGNLGELEACKTLVNYPKAKMIKLSVPSPRALGGGGGGVRAIPAAAANGAATKRRDEDDHQVEQRDQEPQQIAAVVTTADKEDEEEDHHRQHQEMTIISLEDDDGGDTCDGSLSTSSACRSNRRRGEGGGGTSSCSSSSAYYYYGRGPQPTLQVRCSPPSYYRHSTRSPIIKGRGGRRSRSVSPIPKHVDKIAMRQKYARPKTSQLPEFTTMNSRTVSPRPSFRETDSSGTGSRSSASHCCNHTFQSDRLQPPQPYSCLGDDNGRRSRPIQQQKQQQLPVEEHYVQGQDLRFSRSFGGLSVLKEMQQQDYRIMKKSSNLAGSGGINSLRAALLLEDLNA